MEEPPILARNLAHSYTCAEQEVPNKRSREEAEKFDDKMLITPLSLLCPCQDAPNHGVGKRHETSTTARRFF